MNFDLNIETKKLSIIQWLTSLNDVSMIDKILELKNAEAKDWWADLSEEEKSAIEKGIEQADAQKLTPQSEVRKLYEKWL